ncbi:MAG: metal-dependent transcriptional regulator [Candidatus Bipolaricaulia bacterium]
MRDKEVELGEEILEILWLAREEGRTIDREGVKEILDRSAEDVDEIIRELKKRGSIGSDGNGGIELTDRGEVRSRKVVRRHRLAERLLNDVLEMDPASIEGPACQFEHAISAEVEEKICTLLGHPGECPHGKTIPSGRCCSKSQRTVRQAITSLMDVEVGETVKVAYLTLSEEGRLNRLSSLGILPGVNVTVEQKFPAFVVGLEETSVAMESDVAESIFVRNGSTEREGPKDRISVDSLFGKLKEKFSRRTG